MLLEFFQMVDRVERIDLALGEARAACRVPETSPIFQGHFPSYPILPGVLMIETIAQTGGWLIMGKLRFARMPFLAQVKDAKMRAFVTPGETIVAEARLVHEGSGYTVAAGRILLGGDRVAAEAEITYRIMPFPTDALRDTMVGAGRRLGLPENCLPSELP